MDVGRAFVFPFEDDEWLKKVLLTAVISLIPVIGPLWLLGWMVEIARRVIKGDAVVLAGFEDFGGTLVLGLKAFVIGLVYAIPMVIFFIPMYAPLFADSDEAVAALSFLATCCGCLFFLYGLLLALIYPAAYGELAATDSLGAAIHPARILELLRADFGAYLVAWLGSIAAGFIASLGFIFCIVGVIFTAAYAYAVVGHLYGQAYKKATAEIA